MQVIKESNGFADLLSGFASAWGPSYVANSLDKERGARQLAAYKSAYEAWKNAGGVGPPPTPPAQQSTGNTAAPAQGTSAYDQQAALPENQPNPLQKFTDFLKMSQMMKSGKQNGGW